MSHVLFEKELFLHRFQMDPPKSGFFLPFVPTKKDNLVIGAIEALEFAVSFNARSLSHSNSQ